MKYRLRACRAFAFCMASHHARQVVDTIGARLQARWWDVELGRQVRFYGLPIIQRHPTGTIAIGHHVTFRSTAWSNSVGINRRCIIAAGRNAEVRIGNHYGFSGTVIAATESIVMGDRVVCGANCTVLNTDRHPIDAAGRESCDKAKAGPISIESDVFLGMHVTILKGCTIGRGSVVAAGSVVTRSIPEGVVAAGVPTRVVQQLECDTRYVAELNHPL